MKWNFFLSAICMILGLNQEMQGQNNPGFEKLPVVTDGFGENLEIQKDSVGNLWISDKERIIRHNPAETFSYSKFDGFTSNPGAVSTAFIDSGNTIWVGAENGLFQYLTARDQFGLVDDETVTIRNVKQFAENDSGNIIVGTDTGIWSFDPSEQNEKFKQISAKKFDLNALSFFNNEILIGTSTGVFHLDSKGNSQNIPINYQNYNIRSILNTGEFILIGTAEDGLFKLHSNLSTSEKVYGLPYSTSKMAISDLALDPDGKIYVVTEGAGIVKLDNNLQLEEHFENKKNARGFLSSDFIKDIFIDEASIMWIATDIGDINYLNLRRNAFQIIQHDPGKYSSISDNYTSAIEKDENGNIWFGTREGLSIWNPNTGTWQHIKSLSFRYASNIPDVIKDLKADGGHMWVATYNDGLYKINIDTFLRAHYSTDTGNKIGSRELNAVSVDRNKNIWAGGKEKLSLIKPNGEIKIFPLNQIDVLFETSNGNIIAAGPQGVHRIDADNYNISEIESLKPDSKRLPYFKINAIVESQGKLFFGTYGAGIVIYDPATDVMEYLNGNDGMPSDYVQGIVRDDRNGLWVSTTKGLANLNNNGLIRNYNRDDGLFNTTFTSRSFSNLGNNKIAFGVTSGVVIFNPDEVAGVETSVPNLVFRAFDIKNSKEQPGEQAGSLDKIALGHDENSFSIDFLGISKNYTLPINYSWKLKGLEEEWSLPSTQNKVNYANLNPGDYTFQVRARNSDGPWSKVKEANISIVSPWWATTQAYLLYGILGITVIFLPMLIAGEMGKRKSKKLKSEFYRNLNQEIKTPLTILLASLNNLAKDENSENHKKIRNTLSRLNALFEPILNFRSKITSSDNVPEISKINLDKYLKELVNDFQPLLEDKNLEIIVNQRDKGSFHYDLEILNKIFFNLISGSVKYSFRDGKIIINLFEINKGDLKIQIADNGSGIPQNQYKLIREYYRTGKPQTQTESGEELSLLMVKDFIEKTGGSIVVDSEKNEGTTFTLILKNHKKEQKVPERKQEKKPLELPEEKSSFEMQVYQDYNVLVVEDNLELRKMLANTLSKYCQVYEAENGRDAIKISSQICPDIIITDFNLPDMNGLVLNNIINKNINLNPIAVFLITDTQDPVQNREIIESGISEIIAKPINVNMLLLKISKNLGNKKTNRDKLNNLGERNSEILRNENNEDLILKATNIVLKNIQDSTFSFHDLSEALGVSSNSLFLKMKNLTDQSPQDFVVKIRLEHARELMDNGESDLMEVARQSGFSNRELFYSSFKKFYGYMPGTIFDKGM